MDYLAVSMLLANATFFLRQSIIEDDIASANAADEPIPPPIGIVLVIVSFAETELKIFCKHEPKTSILKTELKINSRSCFNFPSLDYARG